MNSLKLCKTANTAALIFFIYHKYQYFDRSIWQYLKYLTVLIFTMYQYQYFAISQYLMVLIFTRGILQYLMALIVTAMTFPAAEIHLASPRLRSTGK